MKTPCFVIDEKALLKNLQTLAGVKRRTGCRILLAQKAFSCFKTYPLISRYLDGTTASGLYEARLGREHFPGEVHVFSPAFKEEDFEALLSVADEIVFNSNAQLRKYGERAVRAGLKVQLRVNPECSTQEHAIYDPCSPGSRMGVRAEDFDESLLPLLDGLHMHTLCEQNSDALAKTVQALEEKFGKYLSSLNSLNLGGGHHITRPDYDIPLLERTITHLQDKYGVTVYLEPGEAVVLNAGELRATVLDVVQNGIDIAILDASAACHMPDVLEMPYRPPVLGSGRHRRLFLRRAAQSGGRDSLSRHGALHHGQDQHLQRHPAARHPLPKIERRDRPSQQLFLPRLQIKALIQKADAEASALFSLGAIYSSPA